jgi:hypothetical protein
MTRQRIITRRILDRLTDDEIDIALGLLAEILNEIHALRQAVEQSASAPQRPQISDDNDDLPF